MKLTVKIDGQLFDVEIGNLSERPIKAIVDGETFEVWPESNLPHTALPSVQKMHKEIPAEIARTPSNAPIAASKLLDGKVTSPSENVPQVEFVKAVRAPIPGVITAILIQSGAEVSVGQELCKLEAMKMNNSIRSTRTGKIETVLVSVGQHVKHNDVLMEYAG